MTRYEWIRRKGPGRQYQLVDDEANVAAVAIYEGFCSPVARVTIGDGVWTIKRSGFFRPRVTARIAGSPQDVIAARQTFSGSFILEGFRAMRWQATNLWHSQFAWVRGDRSVLARYRSRSIWRTEEAEIELHEEPAEEVLLLTVFGAYLRKLTLEEMAAVAVAAS